jgi:predicted metal-binding membrane protein
MRDRALLGAASVLFATSAAVTILWCGSMAAMPGMAMPGGWTMSMAWMRMPGQSWPGAAATFLGMWAVMMIAMMTPSLVPMLARYRASLDEHARKARLTMQVAVGYFAVWTLFGIVVYPLGLAFGDATMRLPALSNAVPLATGVTVTIAGLLQFTQWKAKQLTLCHDGPVCCAQGPLGNAWQHGLRLGLRCVRCCAGPTAVLLVVGVMDLGAMAGVTAAITVERLATNRGHAARVTGLILTALGFALMMRC